MFTGIVQAVGTLEGVMPRDGDVRLRVTPGSLDVSSCGLGDSVAVSGVCLTVVDFDDGRLDFDVSVETLSLTTLGSLQPGAPLNLELAATPATALGGHIVSGHIDTRATLADRHRDARSERMRFSVPADYARYLAPKGSVCLDGVSLTVNAVDGNHFEVNIVPHTLQATSMDGYRPGTAVNLEVDVIARYVERLLDAGRDG